MKLAIYHNLPSGGGKRALYEMTKRLAVRHTLDVYTLSTAEHDFCDVRPLVRSHTVLPFQPLPLGKPPFGRLNQGIRAVDLLRLEAVQRRIAAQIDAAGYDVVFVHNCRFSQSPGLLKFLRTPTVYYCQEPPRQLYEPAAQRPYLQFSRAQRLGNLVDPLPLLYRRTLAALDRRNVKAASLILVNSAFSRESLFRVYGVSARVCYLGVDIRVFQPLSLPKERFVLSVGALIANKGFDFVMQALSLIDRTERPKLIVVSNHVDPREQRYLAELARALAVEVEFQQMIGDHELVTLYNRAAATVYAPVMEPFGFVPLESMACATPVVGVFEGGVRESVASNVTGVLVQRDPVEFADAIHRVCSNPTWAQELGKNGVAHVHRHWTWEATQKGIEDALTYGSGARSRRLGSCS
ncbi:MAG TPA: glycosyltransferase family 4 protein [Chloroflexi bacterium]|nr:glycosyltransferase family 4 protein [Chloroflexota bacterium]